MGCYGIPERIGFVVCSIMPLIHLTSKGIIMTQHKVMEANALSKLIGNIGKSGLKLDAQIQLAAVQCIAYSIIDRNITPGQNLLDATSNGIRSDALVAFFEKHGQFAYDKQTKKLVFFDVKKITNKDIEWSEAYERELMSTPWTGARKKQEPVSQYDFDEQATKFVERFKKLAADANVTVKHKDLLVKLVDVINAYHFEQYSKSTTIAQEHDASAVEAKARKVRRALAKKAKDQQVETLPDLKVA